MPEAISSDVHTFDIYRTILSYGFRPLTPFERQDFGIIQLGIWWTYSEIREQMTSHYEDRLLGVYGTSDIQEDAFRGAGKTHLAEYLREMINTNSLLTDEQKEELIDAYLVTPHDDHQGRMQRLALVNIGILRLGQKHAEDATEAA